MFLYRRRTMSETIQQKICSECKQPKQLSKFSKRDKSKDGHQYQCKSCRNKQNKKYKRTEKGRAAQKRYNQSEKFKVAMKRHQQTDKFKITQKLDKSRHTEHYKARNAVNHAIVDGKLPRPDTRLCHYCPKPAQQYHHWHGYAPEHWLDVVPACIDCHNKLKRKIA